MQLFSSALIAAIIAVESGGNDHAIGDHGRSVGCLQIGPAVVADVNAHLPSAAYHFSLSDRFDRLHSVDLMVDYWTIYATPERLGHEHTDEDLARIWNGGPSGARKQSTLPYWEKVQKILRSQK